MEKKRYLIALGGNAILTDTPTAEAQQKAVEDTVEKLSVLIEAGHEVVITHGNGPQVGNLMLQQIESDSETNPALPLDTLVAMTQGSIGYWLQQSLKNMIQRKNLNRDVVTALTQVVVDKNDPAFENPSKPVGPFLTQEQVPKETGKDIYKEDAGRGWRKVVPSPKPVNIVEANVISRMVEAGVLTIACGGGGIPVVEDNGTYTGIEAVIDKDFASAKLAELIQADVFIVLTGVSNVYVNFNQPDQQKLEEVTVGEMEKHVNDQQFAAGSMLPKVEAVLNYVKAKKDGTAVITSLEDISPALEGKAGTIIRGGN